jgi:hypothetical protein
MAICAIIKLKRLNHGMWIMRSVHVLSDTILALQQSKGYAPTPQKSLLDALAIDEREKAFSNYLRLLNTLIEPITLEVPMPDFKSALRNRVEDTYQCLDKAYNDGILRACTEFNAIKDKLNWYKEKVIYSRFLFNDLQDIITNNCMESFMAIVKDRIDNYAKSQEQGNTIVEHKDYEELVNKAKRLDEIIEYSRLAKSIRESADRCDNGTQRRDEMKRAWEYDRKIEELLN